MWRVQSPHAKTGRKSLCGHPSCAITPPTLNVVHHRLHSINETVSRGMNWLDTLTVPTVPMVGGKTSMPDDRGAPPQPTPTRGVSHSSARILRVRFTAPTSPTHRPSVPPTS